MTQKTSLLFLTKFFAVFIIAIHVTIGCTDTIIKSNLPKNANSSIVNASSAFTSTEKPLRFTVKKWQVGRVSRKHYEIVNMLWRKTKIFVNSETTTPAEYHFKNNYLTATLKTNENIKPLTVSSLRPVFPSSTPSYIEFYYLDDNDERIKHRDSLLSTFTSHKTQRKSAHDTLFIRSPTLSLHVNDHVNNSPPKIRLTMNKDTPDASSQVRKRPSVHPKPSIFGFLSNKLQIDLAPIVKSNPFMFNNNLKHSITTEKYFNNETCPVITEPDIPIDSTKYQAPNTHHNNMKQDEMISVVYNINTSHKIESTTAYDKIKFFEMYDQHTKTPMSIFEKNVNNDDSENMVIENEIDVNQKVKLEDVDRNIGHHDGTQIKYVKKHIDETFKHSLGHKTNISKSEKKSKFKTVIFHVNKTDTKKYVEEETSFNTQRLVQVVGSMSSCIGWAPVSLMSYNFAADNDGSMATAVGWGLDRYDVRYTSSVELPRQPLSAYDEFIFSTTCPGSEAYSKMKLYNDQSTIVNNNLYCLSLPPYSGEENDPVHGSLLLIGGKLIALYLQEERRIWGEQSAQYTGVWRLVPWVHEMAREPDEVDGFAIDI